MKLKLILTSVVVALFTLFCLGQTTPINKTKYKIVFQLTNADTAVHRSTIIQINNALAEAPNSKIELVCHNAGIGFLQKSKTTVAQEVKSLKDRGVVFAACANTIRMRKIDPADIVTEAIIVAAGVIEIADKQHKGWSYIKTGN